MGDLKKKMHILQSPRKALAETTQLVASKLPKFDLDMMDDKSTATTAAEKETGGGDYSAFVSSANDKTMKFDPQLEPLLRENPRRFVIFPIQYEDIWAMYKKVGVLEHTQKLIKNQSSPFHRNHFDSL